MNKEVKEKTGVGVSDDNAIVEDTSRGESENRGRGDNRGFRRTTVNRPLSCSPSSKIPIFVLRNGKEESFADEGLSHLK